MKTPARLEFIGISSYGRGKTSSGEVKLTKDLDVSVEGHNVIVVEDIVDSGITLSYLMQVFAPAASAIAARGNAAGQTGAPAARSRGRLHRFSDSR